MLTREALEIKKEKEEKGVLEAHKSFSDNCSFLSIDASYLLAKQSFLQEKFFPGWNCESFIVSKTSFMATWCAPGEELEESEGWLSSRECHGFSAVCVKGAEILNKCQN